MKEKTTLTQLFLTFFKIGLFTFGGGYAMIAMMEGECVERKGWIGHDDMMNITVIAESTPGPIAINCATFVGCRKRGFPGALAATAGIVCPAFAVIYAISVFLDGFLTIPLIASAFRGIRIGVGVLILDAAVTMLRKMSWKPFPLAVVLCAFGAMLLIDVFSWRLSTIALLAAAAAVGLLAPVGRGTEKKGGGA